MGFDEFFSPRVLIVVGKGGVGKTTVTAAIALTAARSGRRALIVDVEGKGSLSGVFGGRALTYSEEAVADGVYARTITPEEALVDYFAAHNMGRLSRRLARSNVIDYVATAIPGLKDIIVLGKVKGIANNESYDTIVVDSPAAGHAVTFLTGAKGILDAVRVGPIREQAREVLDLLEDHARCRVQLVTLAEETPVNETVETRSRLLERIDVNLGPLVVNQWIERGPDETVDIGALGVAAGAALPPDLVSSLEAAAHFRSARRQLQEEQVARLASLLDLGQLRLPFCFSADFGPPELSRLADALAEQLQAPMAASGTR
jgi:anion-transporting  ArsA/GET3 family ATPase